MHVLHAFPALPALRLGDEEREEEKEENYIDENRHVVVCSQELIGNNTRTYRLPRLVQCRPGDLAQSEAGQQRDGR